VLQPFLAPVVWAAILAYASWPLYRRLRRPLRRFNTFAALLMTLLMTCAVVVPVFWLLMLVQSELLNPSEHWQVISRADRKFCLPRFAIFRGWVTFCRKN